MPFFIAVDGLAELENREKWEEARALLYRLWNADRENIDLFFRVFTECWYVLSDWGCMIGTKPDEDPSFLIFVDTLIECTAYGLIHFNKDTRFLWIAGYMISMFPYLFYKPDNDGPDSGELYLKWETKGTEMSILAYKQNPDDLIARIMYLGSIPISIMTENEKKESNEILRKLTPVLDEYFTDNTAIERHFKRILTDPITGGVTVVVTLTKSCEGEGLKARLYGIGNNAVILSNMGIGNSDDWKPFIQNLPLEQCKVLTYDYPEGKDDQSCVLEDVISYIKNPEMEKIVLIGAGCGGIASLIAAMRLASDKTIIGVVSISAPFERDGVAFLNKEELSRIKTPKLLIDTKNGVCAANTRQVYELIAEPKELCFYSGNAHGTEIFDTPHRDALIEKLKAFVNSRFGF